MMIGRRALLTLGMVSAAILATRAARTNELTSLRRFASFRSALKGDLILPSDAEYERARRVGSFNPTTDKHPAMIARCADASDVIRAIEFSEYASLDVAVRSGGNDVLGASSCDGGMVIDVSRMKRIEIDAKAGIAHVGGGVRARELNIATEPFGLAPVLACYPDLGISGVTLGGGLGWLLGTHGAACDHLLGADIVCADGRLLRATAEENPDLFWAIRGGGGNFGIATGLDLGLVPLDTVLGGAFVLRADIASFLRFYRDFMQDAPDALTVELMIFTLDAPLVLAFVCWSGDQVQGERTLRPLRTFAPALFDSIRRVPYAHLTDSPGVLALLRAGFAAIAEHPGLVMKAIGSIGRLQPQNFFWRGGSLDNLDQNTIDRLAAIVQSAPRGGSVGVGHYMHGEICRIGSETSFVRRPGQFTYFVSARWNDSQQSDPNMQWATASYSQMRRLSPGGTYVNYLSDESESAVKESYGENYARLQSVKRAYDPANIFHFNRNIHP